MPFPYEIKHVAVCNRSTLIQDADIIFWVEAVRAQLFHHAAPLWGVAPPGVMFYSRAEELPEDDAAILAVLDDDGDDEAAGFHTDLAGRIYGVVDLHQSRHPSVTL